MNYLLEAKDLDCYIDGKKVLENIQLQVPEGKMIGIIGPNGCGKSTLIKHLSALLPYKKGEIFIAGENIKKLSIRERAKKMALVSQMKNIPFDFTVEEIVELGRYPYQQGKGEHLSAEQEQQIIQEVLTEVGMWEEKDAKFHHLSGGQQQRILIAKALAQKTPLLLLDEPTNHLDIQYQLSIFKLLQSLPITVVTALHDLNIAALFCDELYVLFDGHCYAHGSVEEILNEELVEEVFQVKTKIQHHPFAISYL